MEQGYGGDSGGADDGTRTPRPSSSAENGKPIIEGEGQAAHGEGLSEGQTKQENAAMKPPFQRLMDYRDSVRLGYELFHMIEAHTELMDTLRDMHLDHLEFELPVETQHLLDYIDKVQIGLQREFCGTTVCGEKKQGEKAAAATSQGAGQTKTSENETGGGEKHEGETAAAARCQGEEQKETDENDTGGDFHECA